MPRSRATLDRSPCKGRNRVTDVSLLHAFRRGPTGSPRLEWCGPEAQPIPARLRSRPKIDSRFHAADLLDSSPLAYSRDRTCPSKALPSFVTSGARSRAHVPGHSPLVRTSCPDRLTLPPSQSTTLRFASCKTTPSPSHATSVLREAGWRKAGWQKAETRLRRPCATVFPPGLAALVRRCAA